MSAGALLIAITCVALLMVVLFNVNKSNSTTVYRFYKHNCRFCVESQPDWDKFKAHIGKRMDLVIVDVDLDEGDTSLNLAKKYNVTSVPTVFKILPNGTRVDHIGPRNMGGYISFVSN